MFRPCRFGKYYLFERIAVGGMAEIYKAKLYGVDGFEKNMVVKQILPQYARSREFIQMFIDEAKISVNLQHGNIVPVYELGQTDGIYFISMDYVDGKNLGELLDAGIENDKPLSMPHAIYIACEILAGLDYAHRKTDEHGRPLGIVHRDVSPQNVLVSFEGEVKLVDFGIARAANKVHATQAGVIKGKFGYMSPEQAMGHDVDARSDIFAAGILLYEMLTLERLFASDTEAVTLDRVKRADVPVPSRVNPRLPPQLDAIVFKALARRPEDRYQTPEQMRQDLLRVLLSLPEQVSAQSLSDYLKDLFTEELRQRRQGAAEPPEDVKRELIRASGAQGLEKQKKSTDSIAVPRTIMPSPQRSAAMVEVEPVPDTTLSDDELDVDFTYTGTARKVGRLLAIIVVVGIAVAAFAWRHQIGRMFGVVSDVVKESADRLAKKPLGTLVVRSNPSGATVYFDGRRVGTTNMRIRNIDPDRPYELVLTSDGYGSWSRKILPEDWRASKSMQIEIMKDWLADRFK
ncbi:MAG: PEGA domain-containing protein [Deltaproteobacteria bacterium]|nr:MAG: PEGA domain-containing protein [Deltaproteobacteria bacterium]